jgi:hypothetical protein
MTLSGEPPLDMALPGSSSIQPVWLDILSQ